MTQTSGLQGAHSYAFLVLPFFGFCLKQHLFWSFAAKKTLLPPKKRSCSKWSRIARMKGNQQTCCRWQWCHSWSIGKQSGLTWFGWVVSPRFANFRTISLWFGHFKNNQKLSETGVRVKTLLYREETLLSREETPLYWFKAPSPKLFCHGGPSTNVSFSTELLWLNVCSKKSLVETSFISTRKSWGIWMSLHDGTVLKTNNGCGWQKIFKNDKKGPRAELKISGAEKHFWQEKQKLVTCANRPS